MPKLTLSADAEVIEQAKRLAEERGTSVSAMFSQFVTLMARRTSPHNQPLGPLTRKAMGMVSLPRDKSDRELIEEALAERHNT